MAGKRLTIAYVVDGHLNATYEEMVALDRKQIYDLIGKRIFENANRRIRNIRVHKDLISPALAENMQNGGMFSAKGKTKEQLIYEIRRAHNFLIQDTATVRGAKMYTREFAKDTPNLTPGERRLFSDIVANLKANNPVYFEKLARDTQMYGTSDQFKKFYNEIRRSITDKRNDFVGGLAGDLLSSDKKTIRATVAQRAAAIEELGAKWRAKIDREEAKIMRSGSSKKFRMSYAQAMEMQDKRNETYRIEIEKA